MNNVNLLRLGCIVQAMLLLTACATMDVGSDSHPQADFAAYATYAWIAEDPLIRPAGSQAEVSALTVRRIREAIEKQLSLKGYRQVDAPAQADFTVAFTVGARDRLTSESYPVPYRGPWPWDVERRYVDVRTYREGTLSIDVFDGKNRQPVWHGWARKTVTAADTSDPGPVIERAVGKILKKLPARE